MDIAETSNKVVCNECNHISWFVMRDLKRANALRPAYVQLAEEGFEVFTPTKTKIISLGGKKIKKEMPILADLLFVHSSRQLLDPIVEITPTLQYRYVRGGFAKPLCVDNNDMKRFICAVSNAPKDVKYYMPDELTASMCGKKIKIIGCGPLDGFEANLLSLRGSRKKRILVSIPGIISASIEVDPEYIEFLE